ncbi:MAG: hypothetical protein AAGB93_02190 [Planctomycetota bacterium]
MRFLKENWIWVLAPFALFGALALALLLWGGGGYADSGVYELR